MNYRSIAALNRGILDWLTILPNDSEVVVGIPRSGLLVANLISLHRNLPMTDVDGLLEGRLIKCGPRYRQCEERAFFSEKRRILVVDDSVSSGGQITDVKRRIMSSGLRHLIKFATVYIESRIRNAKHVDYYYQCISQPRCFEWNVMHHKLLNNACVDIDGVLCRDPSEDENDDGDKYIKFIENVQPRLIPTETIGTLVTCRLKKYRDSTQKWLDKHRIKYNRLVMMDFPDKLSRLRSESHGMYKAEVYRDSGAELFIESSQKQASEIARITKNFVLCTDTMEMANMNYSAKIHRTMCNILKKRLMHPWKTFGKVLKLAHTCISNVLLKI